MPDRRPKTDPRPHRTALINAAEGRPTFNWRCNPRELHLRNFREPDETITQAKARREAEAIVWEDRQTWTGRIWILREDEQDHRQEAREAYARDYRPIQTLDGLDPSPGRVRMREFLASFNALRSIFWKKEDTQWLI